MNEALEAISRLCRSCGFCCNGVLFENVRLRAGDNLRVLRPAGVTLKKKNGCLCALQPCAAWREEGCGIYPDRPMRCREFACHQIVKYQSGSVSEEGVLQQIQDGKKLVAALRQLLLEAGSRNEHRPLLKRCEMVLSEPVDPGDVHNSRLRAELQEKMSRLQQLLDTQFRISE